MASTQYFYYPNASVKVGSSTITFVQRASFNREDAYRSAYSSDNDGNKPTKVVIDGPPRYTLSFTCLDRQGSYTFQSSNFNEGLIFGNQSVVSSEVSDGVSKGKIDTGFITSATYQVGANEFPTKSFTITGPKGDITNGASIPGQPAGIVFDNQELKLPQKIKINEFNTAKIKSFSASFSRELYFIYKEGNRLPEAVFMSDRDKIECSIESYATLTFNKSADINITCGSCALTKVRIISSEQNIGLDGINTTTYRFEGVAKDSAFSC